MRQYADGQIDVYKDVAERLAMPIAAIPHYIGMTLFHSNNRND
jgi:hypothetical protein